MTQRENAETSPALNYERALGGGNACRTVVMPVSVAGGIFGLVWAMKFVGYAGLVVAAGGFRYVNLAGALSALGLAFGGAAGAGMVIAAVACLYRRRWGRLLMAYAAVAVGCASILDRSSMIGNSSRALGQMSRLDQAYFLFSTLGVLVEGLTFPALLVWLMTGKFFASTPPPGTSDLVDIRVEGSRVG